MEKLEALTRSVIEGDAARTNELTRQLLNDGLTAERLLTRALIPAMRVVGDRYESGEIFVPEMLLSAHAMKGAMQILGPLLAESGVESKGKVVIGTVKGDLHDVGQNLVAVMLEGSGFEVVNLGVDVAEDRFIGAVKANEADILAMSALLTTTMVNMKVVLDSLEESGLRQRVKTMIGGAPVSQVYADQIGADGFAPDAAAAVKLAGRLLA